MRTVAVVTGGRNAGGVARVTSAFVSIENGSLKTM
jgi:hypothetical protein